MAVELTEYARYDGLGLAELVCKGEVSARELARLALAAAEKVNPQINAVLEVYEQRVEMAGDGLDPGARFDGTPRAA
jgi:amidase